MIRHKALSVKLIKSTGEEAIVSSQYTFFSPKVENTKWVIILFNAAVELLITFFGNDV